MDLDLAIMDRDSLRDEVAFLHRQIAGLREELGLALEELMRKSAMLCEAEQRIADAEACEVDLPAVIVR